MAFDANQLNMTSAGQRPVGRIFRYDSADLITGAGYFPTTSGLVQGDLVYQVNATEVASEITAATTTEYIASVAVADGTITMIATL